MRTMKLALIFGAWLLGLLIGDLITWQVNTYFTTWPWSSGDIIVSRLSPWATWAVTMFFSIGLASVTCFILYRKR
jgi:ABC-type lipoprotein release transport system permease subunit